MYRNVNRRTIALGGVLTALLASTVEVSPVFGQAVRDLSVEIKPVNKPPRPVGQPSVPMQASLISLGPTTVAIGSSIGFQISTNRSGFGHVYIINSSGKVDLLVENLVMRPGRFYLLPRGKLQLRASPPAGDNIIIFLVTNKRFPGFSGGATVSTPSTIQIPASELQSRIDQRLTLFGRRDWAITRTTVRVVF